MPIKTKLASSKKKARKGNPFGGGDEMDPKKKLKLGGPPGFKKKGKGKKAFPPLAGGKKK